MKFAIGVRAIMWTREGAGVYDGVTVYIRGWWKEDGLYFYKISEQATSPMLGYVPQAALLTVAEWQAKQK